MEENTIEQVLKIWNTTMPMDPTNKIQLEHKFFRNIYAEKISSVSNQNSFSLLCKRKGKFLYESENENLAWILAIGATKLQSLDDLMEHQFFAAKKQGIKKINFSNFSPGYFYPGIDNITYPEYFDFLNQKGFRVIDEAIAMELNLGELNIKLMEKQGVEVSNLTKDDEKELLLFIEKHFAADCYKRASDVIMNNGHDQIAIAKIEKKIVGYSMYSSGEGRMPYSPGERFGCFEVLESARSKGIGTLLLGKTLLDMKSNFIRNAYFLWTGEKASHLYSRFGFKPYRKFKIMSIEL